METPSGKSKRRFTVTGMMCAACSARVEKAVRAVPGVAGCAASLLTNELSVEGDADPAAVVAAVEKAGYRAAPVDEPTDAPEPSASADIQHSAFSIQHLALESADGGTRTPTAYATRS